MNVKQSFYDRSPHRVARLSGVARWCSLLLCWVLGACTLVPLSTLWALRHFELSQLDARQLRVLLYLPEGVATGAEALRVKVHVTRGVGGEVRDWVLPLVPVDGPLAQHALAAPRPGGHWLALGLGSPGQQGLTDLRQRLQAWQSADPADTQRQVTVTVEPQLCRQPQGPRQVGELQVDAWLRWQAGQQDLPLLSGARVREFDEAVAQQALPPCG